jgi:hypothetical protein
MLSLKPNRAGANADCPFRRRSGLRSEATARQAEAMAGQVSLWTV